MLAGQAGKELALFALARPGVGRRKPQYSELYKPAQYVEMNIGPGFTAVDLATLEIGLGG